jgi:hypothetical protein
MKSQGGNTAKMPPNTLSNGGNNASKHAGTAIKLFGKCPDDECRHEGQKIGEHDD